MHPMPLSWLLVFWQSWLMEHSFKLCLCLFFFIIVFIKLLKNIYLFVYFWLCRVLVVACGIFS